MDKNELKKLTPMQYAVIQWELRKSHIVVNMIDLMNRVFMYRR